MKSTLPRLQAVLALVLDVTLLREDSFFISKLLIFQDRRHIRNQTILDLMLLEHRRRKVEEMLITGITQGCIDESARNALFQFSTRLYKIVKHFHNKLLSFAPRVAQISQTNAFLQQQRLFSIELMASSRNSLPNFMSMFLQPLQDRFEKEVNLLNMTSSQNKLLEFIKQEEFLKNGKYLQLIRNNQIDTVLMCHRMALKRIQMQAESFFDEAAGKQLQINPINNYRTLMDLSCDPFLPVFSSISNAQQPQPLSLALLISTYCKEEGYCQFVLSKWSRIQRDMKSRNSENEKQIVGYHDKFMQKFRISSIKNKSNTIFEGMRQSQQQRGKLLDRFQGVKPSFQQTRQAIKKSAPKISDEDCSLPSSKITIEPTIIEFPCVQGANMGVPMQQVENSNLRTSNLYRLQKCTNQNRSYTLRPLTQSKQNKQVVVRQTVMEMKLEEKALFSKILRIRKKKALGKEIDKLRGSQKEKSIQKEKHIQKERSIQKESIEKLQLQPQSSAIE